MTTPDLTDLRVQLEGADDAARLVVSRRLALDLLARAEAADRLEAGVRALIDDAVDDQGRGAVNVTALAALLDPAQPTSSATERDEWNATYFKSGWDAAVREAFLRHDAGQIEDFRHEQRAVFAPTSPAVDADEGRRG